MSVDPEVKRTLDLRLAEGSVSLPEYRALLAELDKATPRSETSASSSLGAVLHQVDDLIIHERGLVVAGRRKYFEEITYVDGGTSEFSINVVARSRRSSISIGFSNGDSYFIDEERAYFGGKRHEAISRAVAILKQSTYQPRLKRFLHELAAAGELEIGEETRSPFPDLLFGGMKALANLATGRPSLGPVYLSTQGVLRSPVTTLLIPKCKEEGVLELGVSRQNYANSSEVYAMETKPFLLASDDRSKVIHFTISHVAGVDVVMSVLAGFANGGLQFHA
jgi:hypothetical protein